jgi:hypothetical protein
MPRPRRFVYARTNPKGLKELTGFFKGLQAWENAFDGFVPTAALMTGVTARMVIRTRIKKDSSAGEKSHDSMAIEKPGRLGFKRAGITQT